MRNYAKSSPAHCFPVHYIYIDVFFSALVQLALQADASPVGDWDGSLYKTIGKVYMYGWEDAVDSAADAVKEAMGGELTVHKLNLTTVITKKCVNICTVKHTYIHAYNYLKYKNYVHIYMHICI